jgi:hypothetical protein
MKEQTHARTHKYTHAYALIDVHGWIDGWWMQAACMAEDGCLDALKDAWIDGWISHHERTDGRTNQCLCQCEEAALRIVPRVGTKLLVVRLERLDHTAII